MSARGRVRSPSLPAAARSCSAYHPPGAQSEASLPPCCCCCPGPGQALLSRGLEPSSPPLPPSLVPGLELGQGGAWAWPSRSPQCRCRSRRGQRQRRPLTCSSRRRSCPPTAPTCESPPPVSSRTGAPCTRTASFPSPGWRESVGREAAVAAPRPSGESNGDRPTDRHRRLLPPAQPSASHSARPPRHTPRPRHLPPPIEIVRDCSVNLWCHHQRSIREVQAD